MQHSRPISEVLPDCLRSFLDRRQYSDGSPGTGRNHGNPSGPLQFQGPPHRPSRPRRPASPRSRSRCASSLPPFPRRPASSSRPDGRRHWPGVEIRTGLHVSFLSPSPLWLVRIGWPRFLVMCCAAGSFPFVA